MGPVKPGDFNEAKAWASSLQKAHDSRAGKRKKKESLSGKDSLAPGLVEKNEKLSSKQIAETSRIVLEKIERLKSENKISSSESNALSNKITLLTLDVLNRRETKRNRLDKKIFRGLRTAAIGLLYLTVVGAVIAHPLHQRVKKGRAEEEKNSQLFMTTLRSGSKLSENTLKLLEEINRSKGAVINKNLSMKEKIAVMQKIQESDVPSNLNLSVAQKYHLSVNVFPRIETESNRNLSLQEKFEIANRLSELEKRVPEIVNDANSKMNDAQRLEHMQNAFLKELKEIDELRSRPVCNPQFEKDISRGDTFVRQDSYLHISDDSPIPRRAESKRVTVDTAYHAVKELIKPGDEKWEKIIQLTAVQTNMNNLFDAVILGWGIEVGSKEMWKENGIDFATKLAFSERTPAVIEVIRDPDTHLIARLEIKGKADLDMVRYQTGGGDETTVFTSRAIRGELSYSVTLDEKNMPVVSDLKTIIEARV